MKDISCSEELLLMKSNNFEVFFLQLNINERSSHKLKQISVIYNPNEITRYERCLGAAERPSRR